MTSKRRFLRVLSRIRWACVEKVARDWGQDEHGRFGQMDQERCVEGKDDEVLKFGDDSSDH